MRRWHTFGVLGIIYTRLGVNVEFGDELEGVLGIVGLYGSRIQGGRGGI